MITAFDLGNNVFTVALLRAQRQCSFNPQCILVESHYTKTTRVLVWRGGVYMCVCVCLWEVGEEGGLKDEVAMETRFSPPHTLSFTQTQLRVHTPECTHCFSWDR